MLENLKYIYGDHNNGVVFGLTCLMSDDAKDLAIFFFYISKKEKHMNFAQKIENLKI